MTVGLRIHTAGIERMTNTLEEAAADLVDVSEGFAGVAGRVVATASSIAPKDTGRMARSLFADVTADGVTFGAGVYYARFVHDDQPFYATAIRRHESDLTDSVAAAAERTLDQVQGT